MLKIKKQQNINQYLDATFGYYTLDKTNKYVLAHFNWHPFSDEKKSKGSYDIPTNIKRFNVMMNRRIERMFEMCNNAKYVLFVTANHQDYQYMAIDNDVFELNDYELLSTTVKDTFGDKCIVSNFSEVDSAPKILELFGISK